MAAEPWVAETVSCPKCDAPAEREFESGYTFHECSDSECGYAFGYRLEQQDDACQLGLALPAQQASAPGQVFLGGIGRRAP